MLRRSSWWPSRKPKSRELTPPPWRWVRVVVLCVFCSLLPLATAQWTEPVPMEPQFGTGVRGVWLSNDNLRLYVFGGLSTLYVTSRASDSSAWGQLVELPHHINFTGTQNSACESPNGDTLYFTSDSDQRPGEGYGWLDVYYSVRTDTGWGPAVNCGDSVNGPGQEWSVGISRDGSMLLLSSHGTDGQYASHKLLRCSRRADGGWGRSELLGDSLHTWMDEEYPTLSADSRKLFFYRSGDIYASHRENEVWRTASPLPAPVNSLWDEMNPSLSIDSRTLWFRSDRSGVNQIYISVDTSVTSVGRNQPRVRDTQQGLLRVLETGSTELELALDGSESDPVGVTTLWNILGRRVYTSPIRFETFGTGLVGRVNPGVLATGTYIVTVQLRRELLTAKYVWLK
jgi:hypothetical protein